VDYEDPLTGERKVMSLKLAGGADLPHQSPMIDKASTI
jgi:hypothetical protein